MLSGPPLMRKPVELTGNSQQKGRLRLTDKFKSLSAASQCLCVEIEAGHSSGTSTRTRAAKPPLFECASSRQLIRFEGPQGLLAVAEGCRPCGYWEQPL